MAHNWSIDEATAALPSLLKAARTIPQYIVNGDEKFRVSIDRAELSLDDLLAREGPLQPKDIEDI